MKERPPAIGIIKRNDFFQTALLRGGQPQVSNYHCEEFEKRAAALLDKKEPAAVGINGLTRTERQMLRTRTDASISEISTAELVLRAFEIKRTGLAVYADTLMAAAGREYENKTWIAGDWNPLYARSGSIQDVILRCASTLVRILDGRSKGSVLRTVLPEAVGSSTSDGYLKWVKGSRSDPHTSLKVLSALSSAAKSGDELAQRLISVLGADIGQCAGAVISTLNLKPENNVLPVHFGGEVFNRIKGTIFPFKKRVRHRLGPGTEIKYKFMEPYPPAAVLARIVEER